MCQCRLYLSTYSLKSLRKDLIVKQFFNKIISPITFDLIVLQKKSFYSFVDVCRRNISQTWNLCPAATNYPPRVKFKENKLKTKEFFLNMSNFATIDNSNLVLNHEDFPSDDSDCDMDVLLAEHLDKIDQITKSYKNKIVQQFELFKQKSLTKLQSSTSQPPDRQFNTSTSYQSKRRHSDSDFDDIDDNSLKQIKLGKSPNYPKLPVDKDGFVHVFTDGACSNNGKINPKAGLGVWFGENHPLNVGEPVKGRATNNVGEIQACTRAIEIARSAGVKKLCINTDSQFVISSMTTWIHNWKKKNWTLKNGGPVKNKYDFMDLDKASKTLEVKWNYVKGHVGIDGNEGADALARAGAEKYS